MLQSLLNRSPLKEFIIIFLNLQKLKRTLVGFHTKNGRILWIEALTEEL